MCGPLYCISDIILSSVKLPVILSWGEEPNLNENAVILSIRVLEEEGRNYCQWYCNSLLATFVSFDCCKCHTEPYDQNFSQFQTENYF